MKKQNGFSSLIRNVATMITILVVLSTLVAGVIDTKVTLGVVERDQGELTRRFDERRRYQDEQYEKIRKALEELKVGQAILRQKIEGLRS